MPGLPISRRRLLLTAAAGVPLLVTATRRGAPAGADESLRFTPECTDEPTPEQTEGPYYTPESPERSDFSADGAPGEAMLLSGAVVGADCQPVSGALVDVWQADGTGVYDNAGYRLRGHVFTDPSGVFSFRTVKPGLYPGRTRHFHVKVQAPGGPLLTTQLYFPGETANSADAIYQPELEMDIREGDPVEGTFTFVVRTD